MYYYSTHDDDILPTSPPRTSSEPDLQDLLSSAEMNPLFLEFNKLTTISSFSNDDHSSNQTDTIYKDYVFEYPDDEFYKDSDEQKTLISTQLPSLSSSNEDQLQIRFLGVPNTGMKSRVETQIKLSIQLMTHNDQKALDWSYIQLDERMLVQSRWRKSQQEKLLDGSVATMVSDESKILHLEAKVFCASNTDQPIRMCMSCVRRERKRAERTKTGKSKTKSTVTPEDIEAEKDKIVLFNCNSMVSFTTGEVVLPTRITCYCRHHNEKTGFRIHLEMKNCNGKTIATGMSPPIMITDDHKNAKYPKTISRKRSRDDGIKLNTPACSRRGSTSNGPDDTLSVLTPLQFTFSSDDDEESSGPLTFFGKSRKSKENQLFDLFPTNPELDPAWPAKRPRKSSIPPLEPHLDRLIPTQGPTMGGIEITLLGSGFHPGLTCLFGDHPATTVYSNPNTIVCVLPPATAAGPVVVSFENHPFVISKRDIPIFTYCDENDRSLLELALHIIGFKMTGKLQDPKEVAMQIVKGSHDPGQDPVIQSDVRQRLWAALDQPLTLNVSCKTPTGHTLLHLAVLTQDEPLVKKLLSVALNHKLNFIDSQDKNGMSALHFACQMKLTNIVRLLLAAGASVLLESRWGLPSSGQLQEITDLLESYQSNHYHIKRKPLSRRNSSVKSHMIHKFHNLTQHKCANPSTVPVMESDGLGIIQQKIGNRLYLFWLPLLIVAMGLLFVHIFGQYSLQKLMTNSPSIRLKFVSST